MHYGAPRIIYIEDVLAIVFFAAVFLVGVYLGFSGAALQGTLAAGFYSHIHNLTIYVASIFTA